MECVLSSTLIQQLETVMPGTKNRSRGRSTDPEHGSHRPPSERLRAKPKTDFAVLNGKRSKKSLKVVTEESVSASDDSIETEVKLRDTGSENMSSDSEQSSGNEHDDSRSSQSSKASVASKSSTVASATGGTDNYDSNDDGEGKEVEMHKLENKKKEAEKLRQIEEEMRSRIQNYQQWLKAQEHEEKQKKDRRRSALKELQSVEEENKKRLEVIAELQRKEDELHSKVKRKNKSKKSVRKELPSAQSMPKTTSINPKKRKEHEMSTTSEEGEWSDKSEEPCSKRKGKLKSGGDNSGLLTKTIDPEVANILDCSVVEHPDQMWDRISQEANGVQRNAYAADIIVIADETVRGVELTGAEWIYLDDNMGYSDLKSQIECGDIQMVNPKVIVLITGRAEAVECHPALLNVVRNIISLLRHLHPNSILLNCAPVPSPRDGQFALAEIEGLVDVLHRVCKESEYLEYARLGTCLYSKRRLYTRSSDRRPMEGVYVFNTEYMGPQGLSDAAIALLSEKLKGKFNSAKLLERYEFLLARERSEKLIDV